MKYVITVTDKEGINRSITVWEERLAESISILQYKMSATIVSVAQVHDNISEDLVREFNKRWEERYEE